VSNNYNFSYTNGTIIIIALPQLAITSNHGLKISKGDVLELSAIGNAAQLSWAEAEGIIGERTKSILTVRPMQTTSYSVKGYNAEGCYVEQQVTVEVIEDFKLNATNVLTPNGDGHNDKWLVRNIE